MRIDYMQNPLAITKILTIPYGEGLHLEGRIMAHVEEGFDEVSWFHGEVGYPANERRKHFMDFRKRYELMNKSMSSHNRYIKELLKESKLYQDLMRGAQSEIEVEEKMKDFVGFLGLKISQVEEQTPGVVRGNPARDLEMLQSLQERNYF